MSAPACEWSKEDIPHGSVIGNMVMMMSLSNKSGRRVVPVTPSAWRSLMRSGSKSISFPGNSICCTWLSGTEVSRCKVSAFDAVYLGFEPGRPSWIDCCSFSACDLVMVLSGLSFRSRFQIVA